MDFNSILNTYIAETGISKSKIANLAGVPLSTLATWLSSINDHKVVFYEICRLFRINPVPVDAGDDPDGIADRFPGDCKRLSMLEFLHIYYTLFIRHSPDHYAECLSFFSKPSSEKQSIHKAQLDYIKEVLKKDCSTEDSCLADVDGRVEVPPINLRRAYQVLSVLGVDHMLTASDEIDIQIQFLQICRLLAIDPKKTHLSIDDKEKVRIMYLQVCRKLNISPIVDTDQQIDCVPFDLDKYPLPVTSLNAMEQKIRFGHFNPLFKFMRIITPSTTYIFNRKSFYTYEYDFQYVNAIGYTHHIVRNVGLNTLYHAVNDYASWLTFLESFVVANDFYNPGSDADISLIPKWSEFDEHDNSENFYNIDPKFTDLETLTVSDESGLHHDFIDSARIVSLQPESSFNNDQYNFTIKIKSTSTQEKICTYLLCMILRNEYMEY